MLFKLSNLNSNLALTLGYLNPALNNSAQMFGGETSRSRESRPRGSRKQQTKITFTARAQTVNRF